MIFLSKRNGGLGRAAPATMTTTVVMEILARACGARFRMDEYDAATGAARYHFERA